MSISILAGFCGQFFIRKLVAFLKRASIIIFILSGVIFASTLTMGIHNVTIEDAHTYGSTHNLSQYYAMWNQPRLESFTIDKETVDKLSTDCEKIQLYRELASTTETGWDFSTRWINSDALHFTLKLQKQERRDFPNGWAPVQHMIVEGLVRSGSEEAGLLAKNIAISWIRTNFAAYKSSKTMRANVENSEVVANTRHNCLDFTGFLFGFSFVKYQNVISKMIPQHAVVDVIGEVIACETMVNFPDKGKTKRRMQIQIQDLESVEPV
ncbi:hypothetical protein L6452_09305 [Arctium lappa]|uniref:Uncharacterized protein n=1 Tax=Arctium lappa TaxID=4217 RepID=A0ACB9DK66_ARCLA|nr:hypothetical protein L6452_09305 [Arctium lappa]